MGLLGKPIKGVYVGGVVAFVIFAFCPSFLLHHSQKTDFIAGARKRQLSYNQEGKDKEKLHDLGADIPELPTISSITYSGLLFV